MSTFSLIEPSPSADTTCSDLIGGNYDAVLIAAQAGADWAWAMIYRSTAPALLRFLHVSGHPHAEAALGDLFVEAARGVRTFGGDEQALRTWLLTIAVRSVSDTRPRRRGAIPIVSARTVFTALEGTSAIAEPLEHAHVAAAVRAAVSGSPSPQAAPPSFRQLRPISKYAPAGVTSFAAVAALVTAKTVAGSALVLAVAAGGAAATAGNDNHTASAPPPAAQPALEDASANAGFLVPVRAGGARDIRPVPTAKRTAATAAGTPQYGAKSASEKVAARAERAHADAAEHRAAGVARAAQARTAKGQRGWATQRGSVPATGDLAKTEGVAVGETAVGQARAKAVQHSPIAAAGSRQARVPTGRRKP